jgi:carboxylate-amine ligase
MKPRLFEPLTVGFDWEHWVVDRAGLVVGEKELGRMVERVNARAPDLPVGLDLCQLELRSGVCRTAAEVREKAARAHRMSLAAARAHGRALYPSAGHPLVRNFAGGHVHVGSAWDYRAADALRQRLVPWVPALVALSANAPVTLGRTSGYASWRAAFQAYGCSVPVAAQPTAVAHVRWGEDVCMKMRQRPTLEVRCLDAASEPGLFAELALAAAGLVASLADETPPAGCGVPDEAAFLEAAANRYNAARHGLAATFVRSGREVGAWEVAAELLEHARPGLARLGAAPGDLETLGRMVALRQTQADRARALLRGSREALEQPRRLVEAAGREGFAAWLGRQAPRAAEPHEPLAEAALLLVRGWTPWPRVQLELGLPPAEVFRILELHAADGRVVLERDVERGVVCRLPAGEAVKRRRERRCTGTWRRCSPPAKRG